MSLELFDLPSDVDFIAIADYSKYKKSDLRKFVRYAPRPELDGYYRTGLLGKVGNKAMNWQGYLSTGTYFVYQLERVVKFASLVADSLISGGDFSILTVIVTIIGYLLAIVVRLPIGIFLTIIQLIVASFSSKK
jgi:hypothetical protein